MPSCSGSFSPASVVLWTYHSRLPHGICYPLPFPKVCHLRLCWLTYGLSNTDGLHCVALCHNHLANIRYSCIKIFAILLLLGPSNIDCCLQLSILDCLEKVSDLCAITHSTVALIYQSLHYSLLFLMECDILVTIPSFLLTIIVMQLSFCFCGLPGHMVRDKKLLKNVKKHS